MSANRQPEVGEALCEQLAEALHDHEMNPGPRFADYGRDPSAEPWRDIWRAKADFVLSAVSELGTGAGLQVWACSCGSLARTEGEQCFQCSDGERIHRIPAGVLLPAADIEVPEEQCEQ